MTIGTTAFAPMDRNMKEPFDEKDQLLPFKVQKPLVLVGLMGVGKTTVGRRLAKKVGLSFVDVDEEIEAAAQMSVAEIFDRFGEAYFRDGERRVIARLIKDAPRVIATGGGAFIQDDTRALILEKTHSIWLNADIETLVKRVSNRNHRPLLREGNPSDILQKLAQERTPFYKQAAIHIDSQNTPHSETVDAIIAALHHHYKKTDATS